MPKVSAVTTMTAYPSTAEGVWVFPFALTFDPAIHAPSDLRFQVQIDTAQTFSTPNAIEVFSNSATLVSFQSGPLGKAVEVRLSKRQLATATTWYWRIRINGYGYAGQYISDWSTVNSFTVSQDRSIEQATEMFDNIADNVAFSKTANSSNIYKIFSMLGREFDQLLLETANSQSDLSIDTVRDAALSNNFSQLIALAKVTSEPNASHRWKTREIFKSFLNSAGTITGIRRVVKAFVGEDPVVYDATNTVGWILPNHYIKDPNHPELQPIIVLYSSLSKGFNWSLYIWNSWGLSYDTKTLENYVNKIKPAHTNTTFTYPTQKHIQLRFNQTTDWTACALTNTTTTATGGVTLSGSNTSGTIVTPAIRISNLSAWDTFEIDWNSSGGAVQFEVRTSPDDATYTAYEVVSLGNPPASTTIQAYVQWRITLTRSSGSAPNPIIDALRFNMLKT